MLPKINTFKQCYVHKPCPCLPRSCCWNWSYSHADCSTDDDISRPAVISAIVDVLNSVQMNGAAEADNDDADSDVNVYCYMVEHCIQRSQHNQVIFCPRHGNLGPYFIASSDGLVHAAHAAPDLVAPPTFVLFLTVCDIKVCTVLPSPDSAVIKPFIHIVNTNSTVKHTH